MAKQNKYNNRLKDLFSGLEENTAPPKSGHDLVPGWTWECDSDGNYTVCSQEVRDILGIEPQAFLGESLFTYRLDSQSVEKLKTVVKNESYPRDETLLFEAANQKMVPIQINLFPIGAADQKNLGWRGFNQVVIAESAYQEKKLPPERSERSQTIENRRRSTLFEMNSFGFTFENGTITPVSEIVSTIDPENYNRRTPIATNATQDAPATLSVPVKLQEQSLGLLEFIDPSANRKWSQDELRLVEQVADQLSLALDNARLFQETQISLSRTEALYSVGQTAIAFENLAELLQEAANAITDSLPATRTLLAVFDSKQEILTHFIESYATPIPIAENTYDDLMKGLSGWCILNRQATLSPKNTRDARESKEAQRIRRESDSASLAIVPLIYRDQIFGTITAINGYEQSDFTKSDLDLLSAMGSQIAAALENSQLFTQTQEALSETRSLLQITSAASSSLELESTLNEVLNLVLDSIGSSAGLISLANPQTQSLGLLAHRLPPALLEGIQKNGLDDTLCNLVFADKKPHVYEDLLLITDFNVSGVRQLGFNSYQGVPLESKGVVLGTLCTFSEKHLLPGENDLSLLQAVGQQIGVAIENANLFEQTQEQAAELEVLNELGRELSTLFDVDEIIRAIHFYTSKLMDTTYFFVSLYNQREDTVSFPLVYEKGVTSSIPPMLKRRGLTQYVIDSKQPLLISENVNDRIEELGLERITIGDPAESWLGVPLIIGNDVLGVIATQNADTPRVFDARDQDVLVSIARQSAIAIQTSRLFQETQLHSKNLGILNEMSRLLTNLREREAVMQTVYDYTSQLMDTTNFFIAIYDAQKGEISIPFNILYNQRSQSIVRLLGSGLSDHILRTGDSLLLEEDVSAHMKELGIDYIPLGEGKTPLSWMGAPMLVGDQVVGVIALQSITTPLLYDQRQLSLLQSIASQTAISLQNVQYFQETQKRNRELALINDIVSEVAASLNLSRSLDIVAQALGKELNVQTGIALFDDQHTRLSMIADYSPNEKRPSTVGLEIPVEGNLSTQKVIETQEYLIIHDVQNDSITEPIHEIMKEHGVISLAIFPLVSGGQVVGTVGLDILEEGRRFTEDEIQLAETIIFQAATAIENARLFEQTQQQLADLTVIQETTSRLSESLDFDHICDTLITRVAQAAKANTVRLMMIKNENMVVTSVHPQTASNINQIGQVIPLKDYPLTQEAIQTRTPQTLYTDDPRLQEHAREAFKNAGIGSNATIPMAGPEGVLGVLSLNRMAPADLFNNQEITLVSNLATQAAIAIQNSISFTQLQSSLDDMAALFQASSDLNAIQSYKDILKVIQNHTFLGNNLKSISINVFDRPWKPDDKPDWLIPVARWRSTDTIQHPNQQYPLDAWTTSDQLLRAEGPTIITDIENDPRLDETARSIYVERYEAKGLVFSPLIVANNWLGHIIAIFDGTISYDDGDIRQLTTLAGQSAIALQNLRSLEETTRKAAQLETAAEIARDTSAILSLEELLTRSVNAVRDRFGFYHSSIFLLDEDHKNAVVKASTGEAGAQMIAQGHQLAVGSGSIIGIVTQTGQPLVVNDVSQDRTHRPNPLLPNTRAELGIPLKIGNRVIGALDVQDVRVNIFKSDDITVLQTLADQISVAIDNARSYQLAQDSIEETRRRVQDLTALSTASQNLASAPLQVDEIAAIITAQFSTIPETNSSTTVSLIDAMDPDFLRTIAGSNFEIGKGITKQENITKWDFKLSDFPATARVIETLEPLVIQKSDPDADPNELAYMTSEKVGTLAIIPLVLKGEAIGVIELETWDDEYWFSPEEINLLTALANQAGISLENARLYEEQIKSAEQLRELDRLKSQFLANMSHELRTPLNSIIGFSRVIMKGIDGPVSDLQQQDLGAIYNAGQHLLKMINDILDISKIDAGKMELAFEDVILTDVVNSVISTARGLIKDKPVELVTVIEENLPMITADSTRIRQILLNFLSNAAKFTDEGSITVTVRKQTRADNTSEIYVSVTDSGIGIAPEDQIDLFEPFTQVDGTATRATGGTGLGLSITRLLVNLHGGEVGVDSDVGRGSTFFFTLPIQEDVPMPRVDGVTNVLAIDDDTQVLQLYERYLSGSDYQLIKLSDPSKAIAYAKEIQPFAITLDILLPELDGWTLLQQLQADPSTRNIPVIVCSISDDIDKGFDLGATDYLIKPILADDLINSLNRIRDYQ